MTFEEFYNDLSYTLLAVGCSLSLFVGWKGGMRLDKAMIFIMLSYCLSFIMELPVVDGHWWNVMRPINTGITQGLLYFFAFEMMRLRDKLESDSFEEQLRRHKALKVVMWVVYSIWFVAQVVVGVMFRYLENMQPEVIAENSEVFDSIIILRTITRLSLAGYMVLQFTLVFRFLLQTKKQYGELSRLGVLTVYLTLTELGIFIVKTLI